MKKREFVYQFHFSDFGRWIDDHWEKVEALHAKFWEEAAVEFKSFSYKHGECVVTVSADWSALANITRYRTEILRPVRNGTSEDPNWYEKVSKPFIIEATVILEGESDLSDMDWFPDHFIELYVYEVFLLSNLACPGSGQFYPIKIAIPKRKEKIQPRLSPFAFDLSYSNSLNGNWPFMEVFPAKQVKEWYLKLGIGSNLQADTGTQRSIFVMYHLCRMDIQVEGLIWVFHALEALLDTRVGENISGLVRRISLLLEPNEKQRKFLNKKLRELYDFRSSFVHGNYPVMHPLQREVIDRRLENQYTRIMDSTEFGFTLLCVLLQYLIKNNLHELKFEERLIT